MRLSMLTTISKNQSSDDRQTESGTNLQSVRLAAPAKVVIGVLGISPFITGIASYLSYFIPYNEKFYI